MDIHTDRISLVNILLHQGADVNAVSKYGTTPLMDAAIEGHLEVVNLLIDNGANVNYKDEMGRTPFIYSCINHHEEVQRLLIRKGADVYFIHNADTYIPKNHYLLVHLFLFMCALLYAVYMNTKYHEFPWILTAMAAFLCVRIAIK
eukprot:GHVR01096384.1.p1 GENE.GHVR01096384.1~~GHVR01096384.1.p1  ORF type:complete len:146 (-),score=1.22 GHVR01096384.1:114-551(-)